MRDSHHDADRLPETDRPVFSRSGREAVEKASRDESRNRWNPQGTSAIQESQSRNVIVTPGAALSFKAKQAE